MHNQSWKRQQGCETVSDGDGNHVRRSHRRHKLPIFMFAMSAALVSTASTAGAVVMTNHGGPILGASGHPFTIVPLYVGNNWGSASSPAVISHQLFLGNLANYLSGKYLPPGLATFIAQYGVVAGATVSAPTVDATQTARAICDSDIRSYITANQSNGNHLAAFGPETLIMVFPSTGFTSNCAATASFGYHNAFAANEYYGVTFADTATVGSMAPFTVVTAHEVFEAATDPIFSAWYQDNGPELCDVSPWTAFTYNGAPFPSCFDNTLSGAVSATGYDPPTAFEPVSFLYPGNYLLL